MNDVMWYLTRSTGIVAAVLAILALAGGFLFSARATGRRQRPNWWIDLHNWLGGAALVFTVVHVATAYFDRDTGLALVDLFVPGTASFDRLAVSWGVIALYLFATSVLTSWPRRRGSRRTWRILHLGSVAGVVLALVHGYQMGSEATDRPYEAGMLLAAAIGTFTLVLRLHGVVTERRTVAR